MTLKMRNGSGAHYDPTPWLAGPPFHIELRTLHVDRERLDQELMNLVLAQGVSIIYDKVVRVDVSGKRVSFYLHRQRRAVFLSLVYRCLRLRRLPAGASVRFACFPVRAGEGGDVDLLSHAPVGRRHDYLCRSNALAVPGLDWRYLLTRVL